MAVLVGRANNGRLVQRNREEIGGGLLAASLLCSASDNSITVQAMLVFLVFIWRHQNSNQETIASSEFLL